MLVRIVQERPGNTIFSTGSLWADLASVLVAFKGAALVALRVD